MAHTKLRESDSNRVTPERSAIPKMLWRLRATHNYVTARVFRLSVKASSGVLVVLPSSAG